MSSTSRTPPVAWTLVLVMSAGFSFSSCTSDEDSMVPSTEPDAAPSFMPVDLFDVEVSVELPEPRDTPLNVGAFRTYPPEGPPLANARREQADTLNVVTLRDLEPGRYVAVAILDYPPASPTLPGSEDTVTSSESFEVIDQSLSLSISF